MARTIADLTRTADAETVRKAIRQADYLGLPLEDVASDGTCSPLEFDFNGFIDRHGLPMPAVNAPVGIYHVDFLWRPECFAVETDGWAAHRGRQALEDDHARGLYLAGQGVDLLRITGRQSEEDPAAVAAVLRSRLSRPS